jgi:hypothetical protein
MSEYKINENLKDPGQPFCKKMYTHPDKNNVGHSVKQYVMKLGRKRLIPWQLV